ncbi:MAG: IS200/IS605 family accessory protein TnpB-related protein [Promethearchaeati archaeon SRVP18_Atabeyarchaeia-1]
MQFTFEVELAALSSADRSGLDDLMARYCSAKRIAYNRLLEGRTVNEVTHLLLEYSSLRLNWRYAEHSGRDAQAVIESQRKLLPLYLGSVQDRIWRVEKLIEKTKSPGRRAALGKLLAKLKKRAEFYQKHIHDGTVPKAIFGGRSNFTALVREKISNREWREARSNQVYSIGQANQKGNANIRIVKEGRAVAVRFPESIDRARTGEDGRVYRVANSVKEFQLCVPSNFMEYLAPLEDGGAYPVRFTRRRERCFADVSFEAEQPPEPKGTILRVCSVDQNPGGFATAITSRDGNLVAHRFLREDRLIYASQGKRDSLVGALVSRIMEFAEAWDTHSFVIEDLDLKAHKSFGRRANRVVYAFVRRKFTENLLSRCRKKGCPVSTVNPAYTSKLGAAKYSWRLGLSVHEAAAYVIGRRFYGYGEKLEKPLSIALGRGRMPRVRVPVRYVWASSTAALARGTPTGRHLEGKAVEG